MRFVKTGTRFSKVFIGQLGNDYTTRSQDIIGAITEFCDQYPNYKIESTSSDVCGRTRQTIVTIVAVKMEG